MVTVTMHGVRGSSPVCGPDTARYGGNTSCVALESPGRRPVVLDLGTGLRSFGTPWRGREGTPIDLIALVTHLHWDHIQGLPFFPPLFNPGSHVEMLGPVQEHGSFEDGMRDAVRPPMFPVTLDDFPGTFSFRDMGDTDVEIDGWRIRSRFVPHLGPTLGYRVEADGCSVAYISDHQQTLDGPFVVPDAVHDLADGADVLIHDAQYTEADLVHKERWGHCTPDFARFVARECGAGTLVLHHHDPSRTDAALDALACEGRASGNETVGREGLRIEL